MSVVDQSKEFVGNVDSQTVVTHQFTTPLYARFVRLIPVSWYAHACLRLELYGCKEGKSIIMFIFFSKLLHNHGSKAIERYIYKNIIQHNQRRQKLLELNQKRSELISIPNGIIFYYQLSL